MGRRLVGIASYVRMTGDVEELAGTAALAGTVALWALNFGRTRRLTLYYRQETRDPIRIGRYAVNTLMVMVAGLPACSGYGFTLISLSAYDGSCGLCNGIGGLAILRMPPINSPLM